MSLTTTLNRLTTPTTENAKITCKALAGALIGATALQSWGGALCSSYIAVFLPPEHSPRDILIASIAFAAVKATLDRYIPNLAIVSTCISLLPILKLGEEPTFAIGYTALAGMAATYIPSVVAYLAKHHYAHIALATSVGVELFCSGMIGHLTTSHLSSEPRNREKLLPKLVPYAVASAVSLLATRLFLGPHNLYLHTGLFIGAALVSSIISIRIPVAASPPNRQRPIPPRQIRDPIAELPRILSSSPISRPSAVMPASASRPFVPLNSSRHLFARIPGALCMDPVLGLFVSRDFFNMSQTTALPNVEILIDSRINFYSDNSLRTDQNILPDYSLLSNALAELNLYCSPSSDLIKGLRELIHIKAEQLSRPNLVRRAESEINVSPVRTTQHSNSNPLVRRAEVSSLPPPLTPPRTLSEDDSSSDESLQPFSLHILPMFAYAPENLRNDSIFGLFKNYDNALPILFDPVIVEGKLCDGRGRPGPRIPLPKVKALIEERKGMYERNEADALPRLIALSEALEELRRHIPDSEILIRLNHCIALKKIMLGAPINHSNILPPGSPSPANSNNAPAPVEVISFAEGIPESLNGDIIFSLVTCPLLQGPICEVVLDPTDLQTFYDPLSIQGWLETSRKSPITRGPLTLEKLIPMPKLNCLLKERQEFYKAKLSSGMPVETALNTPPENLKTADEALAEMESLCPQADACVKLRALLLKIKEEDPKQWNFADRIPPYLRDDAIFKLFTFSDTPIYDCVLDPTDKKTIYERQMIENLLKVAKFSPATGQPLKKESLIPLSQVNYLIHERQKSYIRLIGANASIDALQSHKSSKPDRKLLESALAEIEKHCGRDAEIYKKLTVLK